MEYVSRAWKDPVWSKVISAGIIGVLVWIVQNYLGNTAEAAYAKAFTPVQIPHWVIWLWLAVTIVLTAFVGRALLNKRKSNGDAANAIRAERDPKIEIVTGQTTPYSVTEVQAGHVLSTVRIGIKNTGGKTLSNCKIFIEKICPSTNSPGGTSMLLEGTGFQLRQEDPEKFVDVAAHWDHHDRFRFSTPISGGFFDTTLWMDDNTRRTFSIRVVAIECERSALFEIQADESKKLHLKFLNYTN